MKSLTSAAPLVLALMVANCEDRLPAPPTAPTLIPSESSPAAKWVTWKLVTTVTSIGGPRINCFRPYDYGDVGTTLRDLPPLGITRSAESIRFLVPDGWWNDPYAYVGTVVGEDFTAASPSFDLSYACDGTPFARSPVVWRGQVSGRFSSNGSSLTAAEVWWWKFPTGNEVTVHIDWTATRQDDLLYQSQRGTARVAPPA